MSVSELRRHPIDTHRVEVRENLHFLPSVIMTLKNHDKQSLTGVVMGIALSAPRVDQKVISKVVPRLEKAYAGQIRKFTKQQDNTPEPEINHALQVAIVVALAVGVETLTTEQFVAALGHDFYENSSNRLRRITPRRNRQKVKDSIIALSHKKQGERIFPKEDKTLYFRGMINNYRYHPEVDTPLIKACDQIVVANSPLTKDELKSPELTTSWNNMSDTKISEMKQFLSELRYAGLGDSKAAKLLRQAVAFTELRVRAVKENPNEIPLLSR